ncbi:hypothetical protein [Polaribacter sp.]|uniref:hypothetical protein n=1 Tax=Polaribacter sp. TaxID=1920175 RepID=UPI003F6B0E13
MKVILPENTTHTIKLIPRFEPTENNLLMKVTKEGYNEVTEQVCTYTLTNGLMSLTFDLTGVKQDRFAFDLYNDNELIYKGKVFFTAQNPQDFNITENVYTYV